MCICGFVCVPLIAWGIGVLGIAGGAGIAKVERAKSCEEVERAKSCEAEGKGGGGGRLRRSSCLAPQTAGLAAQGGSGGALQELCGSTEITSTRRARLPPVMHNTKPAPPQGSDGGAINTPKSSEGMCFLCYGMQHECGCASASSTPTGGALLAVITTPKSEEGMCFLCYGMQHACGCAAQVEGEG